MRNCVKLAYCAEISHGIKFIGCICGNNNNNNNNNNNSNDSIDIEENTLTPLSVVDLH